MAQIMTTKELAEYLKLHKIIACEYAAKGRMTAIRIERVWRGGKVEVEDLLETIVTCFNKLTCLLRNRFKIPPTPL